MSRRFLACTMLLASGCSTVIEDLASEDYAPVYPVEPVQEEYQLASGAIYSGGSMGLFAADQRARNVGDILTVSFSESFAAQKSQSASTSKADNMSVDLPIKVFPKITGPELMGGTNSSFSGSGNASQSNKLRGRMSVSVARVLPGGTLEIHGQKKLTLNNGDEYIRLRGVVRIQDISASNVITSDRIAHAEIKYIGAGDIADPGKKGWLRRSLDVINPY